MRFLSRRDFIKDSAVLAALAAAGVGGKASAAAKSEKETKSGDAASQLRVAVIGVNGRGQDHVRGFAGKNNCVVTTICDADSAVIGRAMSSVEKAQGQAPKYEQDIRKVVDDKDIDIISHRHAEPLARAGRHLGDAGRQGRLRREAGQPQRQRRPAHRRGRPARPAASARPARRAAAAPACARPWTSSTPARSARSPWPAACATSRAAASAR